jgi:hypothetical protein
MVENPTENRGSKRPINRRKLNKTGTFRRVGPKSIGAGNPENGDLKTLINRGLKIQNMTGVHLRFVMGKVSSAVLKWLFHWS